MNDFYFTVGILLDSNLFHIFPFIHRIIEFSRPGIFLILTHKTNISQVLLKWIRLRESTNLLEGIPIRLLNDYPTARVHFVNESLESSEYRI